MTYRHSFHVEAPAATVFDFFSDPGRWASLEPEGVQFSDVRLTEEGVGTHYVWSARVAGLPIEGFNVLTGYVPDRLITDRSSSGLEGTWTYVFEPEGSGTRVTVANRWAGGGGCRSWNSCSTASPLGPTGRASPG